MYMSEKYNDIIRKNLHKIRKLKKLTQRELGISVGLSAAAIGNYERGDRYIPAYLIHDFAKALNVPDQFLSSKIPSNIEDSDIANSSADELMQEVYDNESWKKEMVRQQIQTIKLLDKLLGDNYLELMLEEDKESKEIVQAKESVFDFFNNMEFGYDKKLQDYDENFDLLYYTALFFFNYLIDQKKLNKFHDENAPFIKKAEDLIDGYGYAAEIISREYVDEEEK